MNLENLNEKQKLMILIGIAVFVLAGSGFLIYTTRLKKIKFMKSRISSNQAKIIEVSRAKDNIGKFEEELKLDEERLEKVNEKLPREKELPELLGELAELATPFPTKDYVSVVPGDLQDTGPYYKLPLNINMQCTYSNLQDYLRRLESLPRLVKIESVEVAPGGENPAVLVVNLEISVYYLKQAS